MYLQQKALFQVVFSPKVANIKTRSTNLCPLRLNNWVTSVALVQLAGPWELNVPHCGLILLKTLQFSIGTFSEIHSDVARPFSSLFASF